ncbi:MAG TPA: tryptophan--tRNA ligase [Candidatus Bathyarchaeia archaeon]|nr:tryptophan--tRNA ligase [Candidatus Bathyarchaeia archaeon]
MAETNNEEMVVTPWEVTGRVDYEKLVKDFGTQPLTGEILERIKRLTGELHPQLRRRIFFSHRDLDWILQRYEAGEKFVLYTGRGPSGPVHIGHLVPWMFTKYLQDKFGAKLYFQMTDDEKFLHRDNCTIGDVEKWTYENILDIIAVGFDPKKTRIIVDSKNISTLYKIAVRVAKHMTYSTIRATFGFQDSTNIGMIFFPALQAAPAFIESELVGHNVPCLIPAAIDQDPYWRVARDVAPKLGYYKPAQIHCRFVPGLGRAGKMSASIPETSIFTVDPPEKAAKKVMNAFTGGRATIEEQKRLGANPDICSVFSYDYFLFMDDPEIEDLRFKCLAGDIMCGDCKHVLADRVKTFLKEHQEKREKAKDRVQEFLFNPKDN